MSEPKELAAELAVYFAAHTCEAMSEKNDALVNRLRISLKASLFPRVEDKMSDTSLVSRESRSDRRDCTSRMRESTRVPMVSAHTREPMSLRFDAPSAKVPAARAESILDTTLLRYDRMFDM